MKDENLTEIDMVSNLLKVNRYRLCINHNDGVYNFEFRGENIHGYFILKGNNLYRVEIHIGIEVLARDFSNLNEAISYTNVFLVLNQ